MDKALAEPRQGPQRKRGLSVDHLAIGASGHESADSRLSKLMHSISIVVDPVESTLDSESLVQTISPTKTPTPELEELDNTELEAYEAQEDELDELEDGECLATELAKRVVIVDEADKILLIRAHSAEPGAVGAARQSHQPGGSDSDATTATYKLRATTSARALLEEAELDEEGEHEGQEASNNNKTTTMEEGHENKTIYGNDDDHDMACALGKARTLRERRLNSLALTTSCLLKQQVVGRRASAGLAAGGAREPSNGGSSIIDPLRISPQLAASACGAQWQAGAMRRIHPLPQESATAGAATSSILLHHHHRAAPLPRAALLHRSSIHSTPTPSPTSPSPTNNNNSNSSKSTQLLPRSSSSAIHSASLDVAENLEDLEVRGEREFNEQLRKKGSSPIDNIKLSTNSHHNQYPDRKSSLSSALSSSITTPDENNRLLTQLDQHHHHHHHHYHHHLAGHRASLAGTKSLNFTEPNVSPTSDQRLHQQQQLKNQRQRQSLDFTSTSSSSVHSTSTSHFQLTNKLLSSGLKRSPTPENNNKQQEQKFSTDPQASSSPPSTSILTSSTTTTGNRGRRVSFGNINESQTSPREQEASASYIETILKLTLNNATQQQLDNNSNSTQLNPIPNYHLHKSACLSNSDYVTASTTTIIPSNNKSYDSLRKANKRYSISSLPHQPEPTAAQSGVRSNELNNLRQIQLQKIADSPISQYSQLQNNKRNARSQSLAGPTQLIGIQTTSANPPHHKISSSFIMSSNQQEASDGTVSEVSMPEDEMHQHQAKPLKFRTTSTMVDNEQHPNVETNNSNNSNEWRPGELLL